MSNNTVAGGVTGTPYLGGSVLQMNDFFEYASILHPLAVGSIAIAALFATLRISSNRSVAPMNIFDVIVNVALGSTLAGIVNGNSLIRGLIGLFVLLGWQYLTSVLSCHFGPYVRKTLNSPPLVVVFRGDRLDKVMARHRINILDLATALRGAGVWNISEVEACVLESTGTWSIYKSADMPDHGVDESVLMEVPAYKALVERWQEDHSDGDSLKKDDSTCLCGRRNKAKAAIRGSKSPKGDRSDRDAAEKPGSDQQNQSAKGQDGEEEGQGGKCTEEQNEVAQAEA